MHGALSFCLSAALITGWVRPRPYSGEAPARPLLHTITRDVLLIFRRPAPRTLVMFGWLAGFAVVPEGLAVPCARTRGGGPLTAGLLMCAMPAGTAASSPSRPASAAPPRQQPVGRPWIWRA